MSETHAFKENEPTRKLVNVIINGKLTPLEKDEVSYLEIVTFAFPDYAQNPQRNYSVKYKNGHGSKPEGVLILGGSIKVKDKMIIDVWYTGES